MNGSDDFIFVEFNLRQVFTIGIFRQKQWRLEIVRKNKLKCGNSFETSKLWLYNLLFPFKTTQFVELFSLIL